MHSLLPLLQSSVKLLREKLVNTEKYLIIVLEPMGLGTLPRMWFLKKLMIFHDCIQELWSFKGNPLVKWNDDGFYVNGAMPYISFLCCLTLEIRKIFNFETRHKFQVRNFISDYKTFGSITFSNMKWTRSGLPTNRIMFLHRLGISAAGK